MLWLLCVHNSVPWRWRKKTQHSRFSCGIRMNKSVLGSELQLGSTDLQKAEETLEEPFLVGVGGGGEDLSQVRTERDDRLLGLEEAVRLSFPKGVEIADWRTDWRGKGKEE